MEQELIDLAKRHVDKIRNRDHSLEKEQKGLEQCLCEIKAERDKFVEKISRFKSYEPSINVCPVCWINDGSSVKFKPISSDSELDTFECSDCGSYVKSEE